LERLRAAPDGEVVTEDVDGLRVERDAEGVFRIFSELQDGTPMTGATFEPTPTRASGYPEDLPFHPDMTMHTMRMGSGHQTAFFIGGTLAMMGELVEECLSAGWKRDGEADGQVGFKGAEKLVRGDVERMVVGMQIRRGDTFVLLIDRPRS